MLALSSFTFAQQTPRANADDVGRTLSRCLNEVERLRADCRSGEEVRTLEAKLKAADDMLTVYKEMVAREQAETRAEANRGAGRYLEQQQQIKGYEAQLTATRETINKVSRSERALRRSRNLFVGIVIGLSVGLVGALSK